MEEFGESDTVRLFLMDGFCRAVLCRVHGTNSERDAGGTGCNRSGSYIQISKLNFKKLLTIPGLPRYICGSMGVMTTRCCGAPAKTARIFAYHSFQATWYGEDKTREAWRRLEERI